MIAINLFSIIIVCNLYIYKISAYEENTNFENCNITVDLSKSGLEQFNPTFLSHTSCVKKLNISNNNLHNLEPGIFDSYPDLEHLDLSNNKLKDCAHLFLYGGQRTLKTLVLNYNCPDANDFVEIPDFPQLEYLSLRSVSSEVLTENWSVHFPKLKYLDISNQFIHSPLNIPQTITHFIADNVRNYDLLRINSNNLILLNLNNNKDGCNVIRSQSRMSNLKNLYLSNSKLNLCRIDFENIGGKLHELDISNTNFENLATDDFTYIYESLASLDLSYNYLNKVPDFSVMRNLTKLVLDGIRGDVLIQSLETFQSIENLQILSMRYNELSTIPPSFLSKFPLLQNLDLSNNHIISLPQWRKQNHLLRLSLNFNAIKNLDDLALSLYQINSLKHLDIKNNSISSININAWKKWSKNLIINF